MSSQEAIDVQRARSWLGIPRTPCAAGRWPRCTARSMFEPRLAVTPFLGTDTTHQPITTSPPGPFLALHCVCYSCAICAAENVANFVARCCDRIRRLGPQVLCRYNRTLGSLNCMRTVLTMRWMQSYRGRLLLFLEARAEAAVCVLYLASRRSCPAGNVSLANLKLVAFVPWPWCRPSLPRPCRRGLYSCV